MIMEEHFLVTWHESGDEIHFMVFPMSDFSYVNSTIPIISDSKTDWGVVCSTLETIRQKSIDETSIQTYCVEDWFNKYNIKKIIYLPEFGC